jgi:flagellar P-ring protein precursor FlgI
MGIALYSNAQEAATGQAAPKANSVKKSENRTSRKIMVRFKDVARLAGNEKYTLVGYGVVIGLNGTGDSDATLIQRTVSNLMQNFNVLVKESDIKAQNTAAVMVTATISGPIHSGDMLQATVSSIGDATSLTGGQLLLTPILGTDGETWGIAQGPVVTGGFSFGDSGEGGNTQTKNFPTVGTLTNGLKILKDINLGLKNSDTLTYYLANPDYTTASNLVKVINEKYIGSAVAIDSGTIKVRVPIVYRTENTVPSFISKIEQLYFLPDTRAKVVFNERTGTIVVGENVRISAVAISHGNIYVDVKKIQAVSQPNGGVFSDVVNSKAETVVTNDTTTTVTEEKGRFFEVPGTTTVGELVNVLNALGVSSRDIMIIFHVLKASGALHAELESL